MAFLSPILPFFAPVCICVTAVAIHLEWWELFAWQKKSLGSKIGAAAAAENASEYAARVALYYI